MRNRQANLFTRLYRHLWAADREVRKAFPSASLRRIEQAVTVAETGQSGELRIVIEGGLGWAARHAQPLSRARAITLFAQRGVWDTAENCGVLVYILMAEHQLEIIADRGIHAKVGEAAWQAIVAEATTRFKRGDYEAGLLAAIDAIGQLLRTHFPAGADNPNELTNRPLIL